MPLKVVINGGPYHLLLQGKINFYPEVWVHTNITRRSQSTYPFSAVPFLFTTKVYTKLMTQLVFLILRIEYLYKIRCHHNDLKITIHPLKSILPFNSENPGILNKQYISQLKKQRCTPIWRSKFGRSC